ncbi:unnamed protein product [Nippostrongylus brasiliensis]|uniref:Reticulocalbin-3 n=1 Tax=Nippostrongylus brasiliensis TaxID=27835 RepID=A0A158QYM7_NIPBR|nr:unnamed protein product [Nippostrongylus brasiliensis]
MFSSSKKVASEFDEMSPEESKKRLRVLANKMDTNNDGFIDDAELTNWVRNSMVSLDNEEVNDRIGEMDRNNDKLVSWEEYMLDAFPDRSLKDLDADDRKLMEEDEMYFKVADQDGDGKLNIAELAAFLNPENYKHMHKVLVDVTMREKDVNKDGAIDLKEFLGEMADNEHSDWHSVEKNKFMSEYDLDGDGVLRGEEVRRWLIPDVDEVAKQESNHLINGADSDKDGKLSIEEVVDAYNLFVGSEATNYGEDLSKIPHSEL